MKNADKDGGFSRVPECVPSLPGDVRSQVAVQDSGGGEETRLWQRNDRSTLLICNRKPPTGPSGQLDEMETVKHLFHRKKTEIRTNLPKTQYYITR